MNSLDQGLREKHSIRTGATVVLTTLFCPAAYPDTRAAHGSPASNALKLLGKFAMHVATGVATSIIADEARATIRPEERTPNVQAAPVPQRTEPQVSGYKFTVRWSSHDGVYIGTIVMWGVTGTFSVRTPIGIIDQDMSAQPFNRDILLVGSSPRYAGSLTPAFYHPDHFRLTQLPNGEWIIADTCDTQGLCAPVHVVEASTF